MNTTWQDLDWTNWDAPRVAYLVAAVCVSVSVLLSLYLIYQHLRNYTRPKLQRYIVRIIFMVPIYSLCSWFSLLYIEHSSLINLFYGCYEAFLLYEFLTLIVAFINEYEDEHSDKEDSASCAQYYNEEEEQELERQQEKIPLKGIPSDMEFVGTHIVWADEERVIRVLKSKPPMSIWDGWGPLACSCCKCGHFHPGRSFLRWTKRCILQFVIIQPILAFSVPVMEYFGVYTHTFLSMDGYLWVVLIENVSISVALYALALFYHAVAKELQPFKPILKFLSIKAIIGVAWTQSVVISLAVDFGWIQGNSVFSSDELSQALQDWLICVEMLGIAIAHIYAFGHETYCDHTKEKFIKAPVRGLMSFMSNLLDVFLLHDVVIEVATTFDPRTKDKRLLHEEREKIKMDLAAKQLPANPYAEGSQQDEYFQQSHPRKMDLSDAVPSEPMHDHEQQQEGHYQATARHY